MRFVHASPGRRGMRASCRAVRAAAGPGTRARGGAEVGATTPGVVTEARVSRGQLRLQKEVSPLFFLVSKWRKLGGGRHHCVRPAVRPMLHVSGFSRLCHPVVFSRTQMLLVGVWPVSCANREGTSSAPRLRLSQKRKVGAAPFSLA